MHPSILLRAARLALEAAATGAPPPSPPGLAHPHSGVFVTLKTRAGRLRGCIGRFTEASDLSALVIEMTRQSALHDPRFVAVGVGELDELRVSLSILGPREACGAAELEIGRHGVELALEGHRAVFLPQVAPEQGWDRPTLLQQLCLKAGLSAEAWRRPEARLWRFEAEVFGEDP